MKILRIIIFFIFLIIFNSCNNYGYDNAKILLEENKDLLNQIAEEFYSQDNCELIVMRKGLMEKVFSIFEDNNDIYYRIDPKIGSDFELRVKNEQDIPNHNALKHWLKDNKIPEDFLLRNLNIFRKLDIYSIRKDFYDKSIIFRINNKEGLFRSFGGNLISPLNTEYISLGDNWYYFIEK